MNENRRRLLDLLKDKRKGRLPSRPKVFHHDWDTSRSDVLEELVVWIREASAEDAIWGFAQAGESKLFTPLELWVLLYELYQVVNPSHLSLLAGIYKSLAALRDDAADLPRASFSQLTFAHVLCGFEFMLEQNGMKRPQIIALRQQHCGDYAAVIGMLQSWTGGGRVEIPAGIPGLGKRKGRR